MSKVGCSYFPGIVQHVLTPNAVEIMLDLAFSVHTSRRFTLEEVPLPDRSDETTWDRARHCLVVLLGGKRVVVQMSARDCSNDSARNFIPARVYLDTRIDPQTVGYTPSVPGWHRPMLDVNTFFASIAVGGYRVATVRAALNHTRGANHGESVQL